MRVKMQFQFSSSHILPKHPGRCKNLHGHNYMLDVVVAGKPDPATGMVIDFYDIEAAVNKTVMLMLDHSHLNNLLENPTAEEVVRWCWRALRPLLPGITELAIWETPQCCAIYAGEDEGAWKTPHGEIADGLFDAAKKEDAERTAP